MAFESFLLRIGTHWGAASMAWARDRMAYRGPTRVEVRTPALELCSIGRPMGVVTPEGVRIFSAEDQPSGDTALQSAYVAGRWRTGAAQLWHSNLLLACDPARNRVEFLVGEFYHQGRYLAREGASAFFAPEVKAFSNVASPDRIERLAPGFRLGLDLETGRVERQNLQSDWPEPREVIAYADAVRRCRALMEEGLDRSLQAARGKFAVAFSGGIDSSILVYMLAARKLPIHAYHVWFDDGSGAAPEDLLFARRVARDLGFALREIRVVGAEALRHLPGVIYYGELKTRMEIESALFFVPLLEAMRSDGFRAKLSGDGPDTFFAGYETFKVATDPETFHRSRLLRMRLGGAAHIGSYQDRFGIRLYEPFAARALIDFALTLPRSYLVDLQADHFVGKRVVRDAFRGSVPDEILDRRKGVPREVNGAEQLLGKCLGDAEARERCYRRMWKRLVSPPDLGRLPAWAIRSGWGRLRLRRRLKEAPRRT